MPPPKAKKPNPPVPAAPAPVPAPAPPVPAPAPVVPIVPPPSSKVSLSILHGGKTYANAEEWAKSGALKGLSAAAASGAVPQRFSTLISASRAIQLMGVATAMEVVGVMAMNSPEKDKIGHVTVEHNGASITITDLFVRHTIYWKMEKSIRNQPDALSASRILSSLWYYWLEAMGYGKKTLDGMTGRIGAMDIPGTCVGFKLNIVGLMQKKEMCGIIDMYYQKEVLFVHFLHHFQITNNKEKNVPFATGILEACFAQKPSCDSGTPRADAIMAAIPEQQKQFVKFRDEAPSSGINPNDAIIDLWFVNYNSGNRLVLEPSKPVTAEQHSFKEKLALSLLAGP